MEHFSKLLGARLARRRQQRDMHPDADLLTAFAEKRLDKDERAAVLRHLANCADCREVLALVADDLETVEKRTAEDVKFGGWHLRWVAGLAAACLVAMVVWRSGERPKPVLVNKTEKVSPPPAARNETIAPAQPSPIAKRIEPVKKKVWAGTMVSESKPLAAPPQASVSPVQPDEIRISKAVAVPAAPVPLAKSFDQTELARQSAGLAMESKAGASMAFRRFSSRRSQSLWEIDSGKGMLRRSDDGGRSWTPVLVNGGTTFLSLSVSGSEIWAGGEDGSLFHSLDNGLRWQAVAVINGKERVTAEITGIQAEGESLKVTTKLGVWRSSDGGLSWRRE